MSPQQKARRLVSTATQRGKMDRASKRTCEDCHVKPADHRHHEDYSKPLEVVYLCRACHHKRHGWGVSNGDKRTIQTLSIPASLLVEIKAEACKEGLSFSKWMCGVIEEELERVGVIEKRK